MIWRVTFFISLLILISSSGFALHSHSKLRGLSTDRSKAKAMGAQTSNIDDVEKKISDETIQVSTANILAKLELQRRQLQSEIFELTQTRETISSKISYLDKKAADRLPSAIMADRRRRQLKNEMIVAQIRMNNELETLERYHQYLKSSTLDSDERKQVMVFLTNHLMALETLEAPILGGEDPKVLKAMHEHLISKIKDKLSKFLGPLQIQDLVELDKSYRSREYRHDLDNDINFIRDEKTRDLLVTYLAENSPEYVPRKVFDGGLADISLDQIREAQNSLQQSSWEDFYLGHSKRILKLLLASEIVESDDDLKMAVNEYFNKIINKKTMQMNMVCDSE